VLLLVLVVFMSAVRTPTRVCRFWSVLHYPPSFMGSAALTRNGPLPRAQLGQSTSSPCSRSAILLRAYKKYIVGNAAGLCTPVTRAA
jgi:hypothetical protein